MAKLKGFKLLEKLALDIKKQKNDVEAKYSTFYLNSKGKTIINESVTDDEVESI